MAAHSSNLLLAADADDTLLGYHTADFWLNICICHSLIVENREGLEHPTFQVTPLALSVTCSLMLTVNVQGWKCFGPRSAWSVNCAEIACIVSKIVGLHLASVNSHGAPPKSCLDLLHPSFVRFAIALTVL